MNFKKILGVAAGVTLVLAALPVSAQTVSVSTSVKASVSADQTAKLTDVITKSDKAVSARLSALADLNTKVQAMKNVSATEKANISTEVQTNVTGLTALKATVDSDTVLTKARTDADSAFTSFRIYALVIPQGYIEVSADRINTIASLISALSAKLQTRISAEQAAGVNVTALQATLADIGAQTTSATAQASIAQSGVANLAPDQGNATVAASNKAALVSARADTKTATKDLVAARKDIQTIANGLKSLHVSASASATTTIQ